VHQLFGSTTD
jgi:hypothetical protein